VFKRGLAFRIPGGGRIRRAIQAGGSLEMKIGLFTFHFCYNYGAVLQCVALYATLKRLGHDVEVVDYHPPGSGCRPFWRGWGVRSRHPVENIIKRGVEVIPGGWMKRKFDHEARQHLSFSRPLHEMGDTASVVSGFDALITGSDQVWNQHFFGASKAYLLDFHPPFLGRKISYAACCGGPDHLPDPRGEIAQALSSFHRIMVRNNLTRDRVHALTGVPPPVVCDPVLLHEFSEQERRIRIPFERYILVYTLGGPFPEGHAAVIAAIRRERGPLPVVAICPSAHREYSPYPWADHVVYTASFGQWLTLVSSAEFVYTDSFHAALFSMKYRRPFLAYYSEPSRSHRLLDMAARYGVESAIAGSLEEAVRNQALSRELDHASVRLAMEKHRAASLSLLEESLS
jgi:hypothetical protein